MKRIIPFSRFGLLAAVVSVLLIGGGIAGTLLQGGFNLGIDFRAGLTQRIQIAPVGMRFSYTGEQGVTLSATGTVIEVAVQGDEVVRQSFPYADYPTVGELASAVEETFPDIAIELLVDSGAPTDRIVGLNFPVTLTEDPVALNVVPASPEEATVDLERLRGILGAVGVNQIQNVGAPEAQEFLVRMEADPENEEFSQEASDQILTALQNEFGADQVIVKQSDFVGPRLSVSLAEQTFFLTSVALVLILAYTWFRFRLRYAVSAIAALVHDTVFMLGVIGSLQLEVSTATIAAVLTIIGYSLNDTIVIFDRVRENMALLKEEDFRTVVDTSITQSLARTLITSLTTLLAVVAIYIFATGPIQTFALNMIIGILIGTYSTIFVASPILLAWTRAAAKGRRGQEARAYAGTGKARRTPEAEPAPVGADEAKPTPSRSEDRKPVEVTRVQRRTNVPRSKRKKKK
jgi:preprotein translocase subunit SecF